jgi:hypothetical protein
MYRKQPREPGRWVNQRLLVGTVQVVEYQPSFVDGLGGKTVFPQMLDRARQLIDGVLVGGLAEVAAAVRLIAYEPTVALRASVRRHRSDLVRSIRRALTWQLMYLPTAPWRWGRLKWVPRFAAP